MNDPTDPEGRLRADLHEAASQVVADEHLHRRLIDAATAQQLVVPSNGSRTSNRFVTTWMLPAAAAVVTLTAIGSVAVAQQLASGPSIPGDPETSSTETRPAPSTNGPMPLTTNRPPSAPPTRTRTTSAPPTHATSAPPPSRRSSAASPVHSRPTPSSPPSTTHSKRPVVTDPTPTSGTSSPPADSGPLATCSTPDSGEYVPTSLRDFEQHVIGTWLTCSDPSVFGTDDAGLLVRADGTWAKLTRDSAGHLVAGQSSFTKGDWQAIDDSAMNGRPAYQLNLHIDGSGTVIALPHLSKGVDRLALDNNGVYEASYVPTTEPVS